MKVLKTIIIRSSLLLLLMALLALINYQLISWLSSDRNSYELSEVPKKKVALVFGTSPKLKNGRHNLYFDYRMEAVARLWQDSKIEYILVSGDNSHQSFDEPTAMKEALIRLGIPAERIYLDYAGFRTLDSMVRAKKVFGQRDLIIVSQQFHLERALMLARFYDIEAFGYNATDVELYFGFRTKFRELLARIKLWVDLLLGVDPKFLGEAVAIP